MAGRHAVILASLFVLIPLPGNAAPPEKVSAAAGDADFKAAFLAWKALDHPERPIVSIPSRRPVESFRYTSPFGIRTDPFRRNHSFHSGIDLAAPVGTPVHATADATVSRAGLATGYGNLIQLDHGAGIETRYGHLSYIAVAPGQHVKRGEVIGLVGSTGRSTGSHLHYEVRLAGRAINPLSFMAPGDERLALNQAVGSGGGASTAMGGPDRPAACAGAGDVRRCR